jgi:RNase P subunit RPR2
MKFKISMTKFTTSRMRCNNCNHTEWFHLISPITIDTFKVKFICERCGHAGKSVKLK